MVEYLQRKVVSSLSFVENVMAILEERRITNNELARMAGISSGGISKMLRPDGNPSLKNMESIANALGVQLSDLLANRNGLPSVDSRPDDETLLTLYRQLSPERKEYVLGVLEGLIASRKV